MKEELIQRAYELAKERYAAIGVDVEKAMDALQKISLSLHCWQADDVAGFEAQGALTGGIQATGNYPGKARNIEELRQDVLKAASYIPGTHRLNLPIASSFQSEPAPPGRGQQTSPRSHHRFHADSNDGFQGYNWLPSRRLVSIPLYCELCRRNG